MLTLITNAEDIAKAQAAFENRVQGEASSSVRIKLGYQGGGREAQVNYFKQQNFWISFADARNRYWNAFGIGNPFRDDRTIVAEINPPITGINRRVSGAFVEDVSGKVYLAHRGRVGGGRKGIGKKAFLAWYQGTMELVMDGERNSRVIVVGALEDASLIDKLAAFTTIVPIFKNSAVKS